MRPHSHFLAVAIAVSIACLSSAHARADDSAATVRQALAQLDTFLGSGANAEAWAKYLDLAALRSALAPGEKVDRQAVAGVAKQLASGAKGLELKQFVALRTAVDAWLAELEILQAPNLGDAVLAAEAGFRPITDAEVAASKSALEAAAAKLDRYLSGANGAAWKKYLQWDELQAQLKAEKPDVETLGAIYQKFIADQVGLEMPVFARVADALARWVNDLVGRDDQLREKFAAQLKGLADALAKHGQNPSNENAIEVGSRLGWLVDMRQAAPLVGAIRSRYAQSNLHVAATARLVGAGIEQHLDEMTPVRDYILGTSIHGKGHTVGDVAVQLVPDEHRAVFDTMLAGTVQSRTTGYNGPATIYSSGSTSIAGRKRIVFTADGFASYPATAAANTSTRITGIGGRNIVQRVAWKRVGEQKPEAERIAGDHAADRVCERLDAQVGEELGRAHADYLAKVRNPLLRRREFPELRFRTTNELLFVDGLAANRSQIAASTPPPAVTAKNDLAVQVHESMINNLAAALFSGRTLTEEEMQKQVIDIRGELPDSLKSDPDQDPWSITFARSQPVTVKFADDQIEITIRGQRYTSGDRDFRAMNVTARYKFAIDGPGIKLTRQGDLVIVPPGEARRLSGREITLRTLLEKRFGKLFEPEVKYDGLVLPGKWRAAGVLDYKQLQTAGGWLVAAWFESGVPAPPEKEKPAQPQKADRVTRAGS
jgi:hypothetical protein